MAKPPFEPLITISGIASAMQRILAPKRTIPLDVYATITAARRGEAVIRHAVGSDLPRLESLQLMGCG